MQHIQKLQSEQGLHDTGKAVVGLLKLQAHRSLSRTSTRRSSMACVDIAGPHSALEG